MNIEYWNCECFSNNYFSGQKFALLEEKVVIATILRKYKITSVEKPSEIKLLFELILKTENGINIKLEKRV